MNIINICSLILAVIGVSSFIAARLMRPKFPPIGDHGVSWDHFWQNLDKFIIVFLFVVTLGMTVHMIHRGTEATSLQWIEGITGQLVSAVLALMGAKAFNSRSNGNGNGTPPTPPPPAS